MPEQNVTSTLQRVVAAQLRVHGLELSNLLGQYPDRSFVSIRDEIVNRTGIALSSRTVRRWWKPELKQAS